MRFLVDECSGPKVAAWLAALGHEIFSVFDEARGMQDEQIIQKAYEESWILITNDRDFGEKSFESAAHIAASYSCVLATNVLPIKLT